MVRVLDFESSCHLHQNLHSETCIQALSETRKGDSGGEFWAESMSQLLQLGLHLPETFRKNPYIRPFLNLFSNLLYILLGISGPFESYLSLLGRQF